jgi:hypothetical protein
MASKPFDSVVCYSTNTDGGGVHVFNVITQSDFNIDEVCSVLTRFQLECYGFLLSPVMGQLTSLAHA